MTTVEKADIGSLRAPDISARTIFDAVRYLRVDLREAGVKEPELTRRTAEAARESRETLARLTRKSPQVVLFNDDGDLLRAAAFSTQRSHLGVIEVLSREGTEWQNVVLEHFEGIGKAQGTFIDEVMRKSRLYGVNHDLLAPGPQTEVYTDGDNSFLHVGMAGGRRVVGLEYSLPRRRLEINPEGIPEADQEALRAYLTRRQPVTAANFPLRVNSGGYIPESGIGKALELYQSRVPSVPSRVTEYALSLSRGQRSVPPRI